MVVCSSTSAPTSSTRRSSSSGPWSPCTPSLANHTTPTEDDVFLSLRHAAGDEGQQVVSHLWGGSVVGAPGPRTRVLGSEGAYVVTTFENDASPFEEMDADAPEGSQGWLSHGRERTPVQQAPGGHEDFYPAVAAWVLDGGPVPVDPEETVATARVLDAARESADTGARISLG